MRWREQSENARFEQTILGHLNAAYNLARWLTRNVHDAEDVVQDACLRAFKSFGSYQGGDSRAWLLKIVRNTCYTWLRQNRRQELVLSLDAEMPDTLCDAHNPEILALRNVDVQALRMALEELPVEYREIIVLRELEGLSYKEISDIAELPLGTVMSRLARARKRLQQALAGRLNTESHLEL